MTTKYRLKRRQSWQGLRTRRDFITSLIRNMKIVAEVSAGVIVALLLLGWMQERDLRDKEQVTLERARLAETKAQKMLAHVLNGHALLERNTGTVLFVQVSRQEGL